MLLNLYPRKYREEYEEELYTVFSQSLNDAFEIGGMEFAKTILDELLSMPKAIIHEYLRERRKIKMTGKFASRFEFAPGSRNETLAALAPFLLLGALPVLFGFFRVRGGIPNWLEIVFTLFMWVSVLSLLIIGFVKRVPRWLMPYLGLPLPLIGLLLFNGLMEKLGGVWWYRLPWFLADFLQQGLFLTGLVLLVVLLLFVTRLLPNSKSFYERLRDDWTLLSFIIYGTMPLMLVFTYSDYKNEEPFMFLSLVSLAAGGWLYLRSYEPLKRFLYLYGGVALSMMVAAVGKAVLRDSSFPTAVSGSWQTEFISTLITWLWLALIMLIPVSFKLFSHTDDHPKAV